MSVLDIGCGEGTFLGLLNYKILPDRRCRSFRKTHSFEEAFHPKIEFHSKNTPNLQETFDVLEHIPDKQVTRFLSTMYFRSKPGRHIIICVPTNAY